MDNIHQGDVIHNRSNDPLRAYHGIPFPRNPDIVRRTDLVVALDELLPHSSEESQSAALCGFPGKTQIALEYAYRRCDDPACSVFWVNADTEITFAQDYKRIANRFGLSSSLEVQGLLEAVRDQIGSQSQWLLVLDNADELGLFGSGQTSKRSTVLDKYIPTGPKGTVLWTSRDERITSHLADPRRVIPVTCMTVDEAKALLETAKNERITDEEIETAQELLRELQWLPLAIYQAGSYMRRTSTPLKDYLSRLLDGNEPWRIFAEVEPDVHRRPLVSNSILETWRISIERIQRESETAYRILHTIAYLDNQNVPLPVMVKAAAFCEGKRLEQASGIDQQVENAIIRLREFSFISARETDGSERSFEMHKLVQDAVRYGLSIKSLLKTNAAKPKSRLKGIMKHTRKLIKGDRGNEEEVFFSRAALQVITDLFPEPKREAWAECDKYVAHAVRVSDWSETCGKGVEISDLLTRVSSYLGDCGSWMGQEVVDKKALQLRRNILGETHHATLSSMSNLALTYRLQGRWEEAEKLQVQVLETVKTKFDADDPQTLQDMNNLASTYAAQGRWEEAEELKVHVMKASKAKLGADHPKP